MSDGPDDWIYGRDEVISTVQAEIRRASAKVDGRDARVLMASALGVEADRITLMAKDGLTRRIAEAFWSAVELRAKGVPASHLLGYREFYGRRFVVTPDVLDPRGDTETLIEAALTVPFESLLDLGTGSGCILVTLLAERDGATGIGSDLSEAALDVARQNAKAHGVSGRCAFEPSDWFGAVGGTFDLIVSNPPYIAAEEMAGLARELTFEPRMALTDEGDGLSCYRIIAAQAGPHLVPGGWVMVEIGPTQGAAVVSMMETAGLANVGIRRDLDGRDRVVLGQKPL